MGLVTNTSMILGEVVLAFAVFLFMILLSTIIKSIPPGSRDLVEFGFFMVVGITAGSGAYLTTGQIIPGFV